MKGVEDVNRRLKRLIEEEERTASKIEELQEHLKELRLARKQEEDIEIVRSIRTMKLGARDLFSLLSGIHDGRISIESLPETSLEEADIEDSKEIASMVSTAEHDEYTMAGAEKAPESEGKNG